MIQVKSSWATAWAQLFGHGKTAGLLRLRVDRGRRQGHVVLSRQPLQAADDLVRRALRSGFAGGHLAHGRLLQADRVADLGLCESSSLELGEDVGNVHEA